ncbi:serine hydrolase domain-containing protein [Luteibacter aegosomatissinici]|uniref:serine hydrolase domain-containing protein n=1 Tax=Luteibacter aegosomatissinici TaxID=2911539 RepID=UPI001FFB1057|nr:serine hydrolase domain-containing protein [Luteibacter aegosomatissinici]UPG93748.1 beta-lactamase family protein [Luteibacter aegosomatissinici]
MRRIAVILSCLAFTVTAFANDDSRLDALMQRYQGDVPGASLLVLKDGKPLVSKGYGFSDLEAHVAAAPSTDYRLASVSKQFTAAAILLLAQDGKLSLDDHVRQWLPALPAVTEPITIKQLLSHQGGLIDYEDIMPADTSVPLRDKDVLDLLSKTDHLYFPPGRSYRYSNGGYAMLALIVEKASGVSFQAFLKARIFDPLGMKHTLAFVKEGPAVPHRAFGYSEEGGRWVRTDQSMTSSVLGDGGIYSNIEDLARWDAALYDSRLLSDASRKAAFTGWTATDDPTIRYGYGWRLTGDTLWHSGETIGFRNVIVRYPKQHLTVVLLTNRNDPEPYKIALEVAALYL